MVNTISHRNLSTVCWKEFENEEFFNLFLNDKLSDFDTEAEIRALIKSHAPLKLVTKHIQAFLFNLEIQGAKSEKKELRANAYKTQNSHNENKLKIQTKICKDLLIKNQKAYFEKNKHYSKESQSLKNLKTC